eukprot:2072476-Rhodomonas_salina.1
MLDQAKLVLDGSSQPFAQHVAATAMTKLLTLNWGRFSTQQRVDVRNYVRRAPPVALTLPNLGTAFTELAERYTLLPCGNAAAMRCEDVRI